jgi:predicted secreted protein
MQLNELLEKHSLKEIAKRTTISEDVLEMIFNKEFEALTKVKTMGFISIVEREFQADLSGLKKEAKDYFDTQGDDIGVVFEAPASGTRKREKLWLLGILILAVIGGGWYASTLIDNENIMKLRAALPSFFTKAQKSETSEDTISDTQALIIEDDSVRNAD